MYFELSCRRACTLRAAGARGGRAAGNARLCGRGARGAGAGALGGLPHACAERALTDGGLLRMRVRGASRVLRARGVKFGPAASELGGLSLSCTISWSILTRMPSCSTNTALILASIPTTCVYTSSAALPQPAAQEPSTRRVYPQSATKPTNTSDKCAGQPANRPPNCKSLRSPSGARAFACPSCSCRRAARPWARVEEAGRASTEVDPSTPALASEVPSARAESARRARV